MPSTAPALLRLLAVYGSLLGLLVLTTAVALLPPGWWSTPVALGIAAAKAGLIFYFFMRLNAPEPLLRVFALAGCFMLAVLMVLTATDYFTRAWPR
jgi:cytochrome c oxidase subunit 4